MAHGRTLDAAFGAVPYGGDAWTLVADGPALGLARSPPVFTLGNGFIGVRGPGDPPGSPRVYLNGVFERTRIAYHEAAHGYPRTSDTRMAVADATTVAVTVGGEPAMVEALSLDMRRGLLIETRRGAHVTVTVQTLVSMTRPGIVAARVTLHADRPTRVRVAHRVDAPPGGARPEEDGVYDPRIGPAPAHDPWAEVRVLEGPHHSGRVDRLDASGYAVAALARALDCAIELAEDETRTIDCLAAYAACRDSARRENAAPASFTTDSPPNGAQPVSDGAQVALGEAELALLEAFSAGFDALADEQAAWFANHWRGAEVALPADARAEQALRHGLFQLVQGVGRDGKTSLAAKGQSGEGYEGHVFWDAEIYALPVFVHTAPEIARGMLVWRIARLDKARANARLMGHMTGALYPWRTIDGAECSSFFPAGAAQYHLNADIAWALRLYIAATGDRTILAEGGAAMLAETARIWLQVGHHDPARGFVINRVTGPDEYSALVDNNLYTNLMAAQHLRFAAEAGEVEPDEAATMIHAADTMYIAHDDGYGVPAQDDRFFALTPWPFHSTPACEYPLLLHHHPLAIYRHRVAKQADAVLAAALLPATFDPATKKRMLDVYETVTVHDSTLSASAFSMLAAQVQDERAAAYWRASVLTDLADLFGNSGHGLHMAALAGSWNALALGFAGVRSDCGHLAFAPHYPANIGPYTFAVAYHGRRVRLRVDAASAHYELLEGDTLDLTHHGQPLTLGPGQPATRAL